MHKKKWFVPQKGFYNFVHYKSFQCFAEKKSCQNEVNFILVIYAFNADGNGMTKCNDNKCLEKF